MSNPFAKYLFPSQNRRSAETHPKRTVFLTNLTNSNKDDEFNSKCKTSTSMTRSSEISNDNNDNNKYVKQKLLEESNMLAFEEKLQTNNDADKLNITNLPTSISSLANVNSSHTITEIPFSPNGTNSGYEQILEWHSRDVQSQLDKSTYSTSTSTSVVNAQAESNTTRYGYYDDHHCTMQKTNKKAEEYFNPSDNSVFDNQNTFTDCVITHYDEPEAKRVKNESVIHNNHIVNDKCDSQVIYHTPEIMKDNEEDGKVTIKVYKNDKIPPPQQHDSNNDYIDDNDEDDELHLLLGSQEAKRVKAHEQGKVTNMRSAYQCSDVINSHVDWLGDVMEEEKETNNLPTIDALPWQSRSHTCQENTLQLFEKQFEFLLHHNSALYNSFAPFFKAKLMQRIKNDSTLTPQFTQRTPTMSVELITSLLTNQKATTTTTTTQATDTSKMHISSFSMPKTQNGLSLRSYQLEGVLFLLTQFEKGMSCILADDMGLGKTAQLCSFLRLLWIHYNIDGPHLIVAPLSTLTNWTRELAQWAPELIICKYHGEKQTRQRHRHVRVHTNPNQMKKNSNNGSNNNASRGQYRHVVFITTPSIFHQERSFFCKQYWVSAIVDEAHVLKSNSTRISHAARKLRSCFRVAVTGTPIQNNVGEVWNLMGFLYPHFVSSGNYNYNYHYNVITTTTNTTTSITSTTNNNKKDDVNTISNNHNISDINESSANRSNTEEYITSALNAAEHCANLLNHIMLRRTKEMVELGIPPRIDHPVTFLEPTHVQLKLLSLLTAHALEDANGRNARLLQGHFTRQRIICNHPLALQLLVSTNTSSTSYSSQTFSNQASYTPFSSRNNNNNNNNKNITFIHQKNESEHCLTQEENSPLVVTPISTASQFIPRKVSAIENKLHNAGIAFNMKSIIHSSAKMRYLDVLLLRLKSEGHRVLIFSNFTSTLDFLEALCVLRAYSYERLDGTCNRVERELAMLRFNHSHSQRFIFLVTTTAGGVGITLTGADVVILFDAHYNPQLDRQAADRAHRIGQTRPVHVFRLCLRNTIEESIRVIAMRKASLGDYIIQSGINKSNKVDQSDATHDNQSNSTKPSSHSNRTMHSSSPNNNNNSSSSSNNKSNNNTLSAEEMRVILQDLLTRNTKCAVDNAIIDVEDNIEGDCADNDVTIIDNNLCGAVNELTTVNTSNSEILQTTTITATTTTTVTGAEDEGEDKNNVKESDEMVQRLLQCIESGAVEQLVQEDEYKDTNNTFTRAKFTSSESSSLPLDNNTHKVCFVCKKGMKPLKMFYHCMICPKLYHAECVHEKVLEDGEIPKRQWVCPRHNCYECNKPQSADGAIFMCVNCPRSFCFDCLNPHYYALSQDGLELEHISREYDGMYMEGVQERRSCYYITCMKCKRIMNNSKDSSLSSSSSSSSSSCESSSSSLCCESIPSSDSDTYSEVTELCTEEIIEETCQPENNIATNRGSETNLQISAGKSVEK